MQEQFVAIADARRLVADSPDRPLARQTILTLGLKGELDVRMIAGRVVVTRSSIHAHMARRTSGGTKAA